MKIPNPFAKATTQTNLTTGSDGTLVSQSSQSNTNVQSVPKVEQQIQTLVPGQTLQGEVVSKNGNEITLKLAEDMVLTARLEREINIELGKLLTFQVKNNGKVLSLSPLFANMAMETTAGKALDMANIPLTDRSLQMASLMMEKGMPVDVSSIQNVYKDVANFGDATVEHIIRLHQMDIPVKAETIKQLIQYENMEHQLSMGVSQLVSDIQTEELTLPLFHQILEITGDETNFIGDNSFASTPLSSEVADVLLPEQILQLKNELQGYVSLLEQGTAIEQFVLGTETTDVSVKELLEFVNQIITQHNEMEYFAQTAQPLNILNVNQPDIYAGIKEFLKGPIITKLISAHLADQWTLLPQEASEKQKVLEVYERLSKQLEGLKQAIETSVGKDNSAFKTVNTLQNNVNFMNYVNHMYNYVQIPLTLNGKFSQGELYVYSGKKNLAKQDGSVSALLHLDMEHLGPVDVYVAMQNQNVTTNFYLETDELLDFIHQHIHILDEHLAKRGYSLSAKMIVRDELAKEGKAMNVMEQIEKEDPDKMVLSHFAFDVRA